MMILGVTSPHWSLCPGVRSSDWGRHHPPRRRPGRGNDIISIIMIIVIIIITIVIIRTVSWSRWLRRTGRTAGGSKAGRGETLQIIFTPGPGVLYFLNKPLLQMFQRARVCADLRHRRHPGNNRPPIGLEWSRDLDTDLWLVKLCQQSLCRLQNLVICWWSDVM